MEPGDWATWAGAFGSVAAAVVPLVLFLRERKDRQAAEKQRDTAEAARQRAEDDFKSRELALLTERQERDDEDRKRAQAHQVHAWFHQSGRTINIGQGRMTGFFRVGHESAAPVFHVHITASCEWRDTDLPEPDNLRHAEGVGFSTFCIPPRENTNGDAVLTNGDMTHQELELLAAFDKVAHVPPSWVLMDAMVDELSFQDANGNRWERHISGELTYKGRW